MIFKHKFKNRLKFCLQPNKSRWVKVKRNKTFCNNKKEKFRFINK